MLPYHPRDEFHLCLEDRAEIRVGARFHLGEDVYSCLTLTRDRDELNPGVKLYVQR